MKYILIANLSKGCHCLQACFLCLNSTFSSNNSDWSDYQCSSEASGTWINGWDIFRCSIWHHWLQIILSFKLQKYAIRGLAHDWLTRFLEDRHQFVIINDVNSNLLIDTYGVPQGSVLGPLLFILYINDLCLVFSSFKYIFFADDQTTSVKYKRTSRYSERDLQTLKNSLMLISCHLVNLVKENAGFLETGC